MGIISKTRRFNVNNTSYGSTDADGCCSIEQFAAGKDDFRVAPLHKIPTPWPFKSQPASKPFHLIVKSLEPSIREILKSHDINLHRISNRALSTKGFQNVKDTLILLTFDDDPSQWKQAAQDIYEEVKNVAEKENMHFRVEIRNERKMHCDTSTVIIRNSDIHKTLLTVRPLVEEAVQKACPDAWKTISYQMRGRRDQRTDRKPTIMVMINPGTRHIWELVERRIDEALQSAEVSMDIEIFYELYSGYLMDLAPPLGCAEPIVYRDLAKKPTNGSSIGPRGSLETGSLGVFVYFQPEGETKKKSCVLTCYHVVGPGDPANQYENDIHGIGLVGQTAPTNHIQIDYPSYSDAVATVNGLSQRATPLDEKMEATLATIQRHKNAGGIGEVICASGQYKGGSGRRMDWAIIELNSPLLFRQNKPPIIPVDDPRQRHLPSEYMANENDVVAGVGSDLEELSWVAKTGRSRDVFVDGFTAGHINCMDGRVRWEDGAPDTMETVVDNEPSGVAFALRGDSGSMVTDFKKQWVGIVISGESTGDTGYMMLAQEIIDDIKAKTGGTVTLP